MMTDEEIEEVKKQLEADVTYFSNISFPILSGKFAKALEAIKSLQNK